MKIQKLFLTIGAVALTAITINAFASDALLSPRAADNQIKHVSGSANTQGGAINCLYAVPRSSAVFSPRAQANQIMVVKGVNKDVNPALLCRKNMTGSPKAVGECSSHTTMPGCMTATSLK